MSKILPIDLTKAMSGKICMHSDFYYRYNRQTHRTSSGRICNPSTKAPTEAQIAAKARFVKVSAAIRTILANPTDHTKYLADFRKQTAYGTLFGYVFARLNANYDAKGDPIA